MSVIKPKQLYEWCKIPCTELANHPNRKIPFRPVKDSQEMGEIMAQELVDDIKKANQCGTQFRAIVPCEPISDFSYERRIYYG